MCKHELATGECAVCSPRDGAVDIAQLTRASACDYERKEVGTT